MANWTFLLVLTLGCRDSSFVSDQPIQLTEAGAVTAQADAQPESAASEGAVQQESECSTVADGAAVALALKDDTDEYDAQDDDSDDHKNESHCESDYDHDHDNDHEGD